MFASVAGSVGTQTVSDQMKVLHPRTVLIDQVLDELGCEDAHQSGVGHCLRVWWLIAGRCGQKPGNIIFMWTLTKKCMGARTPVQTYDIIVSFKEKFLHHLAVPSENVAIHQAVDDDFGWSLGLEMRLADGGR